eukprot:gene803-biopygen16698
MRGEVGSPPPPPPPSPSCGAGGTYPPPCASNTNTPGISNSFASFRYQITLVACGTITSISFRFEVPSATPEFLDFAHVPRATADPAGASNSFEISSCQFGTRVLLCCSSPPPPYTATQKKGHLLVRGRQGGANRETKGVFMEHTGAVQLQGPGAGRSRK